MDRLKNRGRQSQTEQEFGEILEMADPIIANFVARHEALRARVAYLERALERLSSLETDTGMVRAKYVRTLAQEALDG